MGQSKQISFRFIASRTMVAHTVTYCVVGLIAFALFDYAALFEDPTLRAFLRQTDDPRVAAGVLFQPIRGFLFGIVFYLLRESVFAKRNGWVTAWLTLVIVGVVSTFGPAPGSIEGFIYTKLPVVGHIGGMIEVLTQSLLLSVSTVYWVKRPHIKWLTWALAILFVLALLLPSIGLVARLA